MIIPFAAFAVAALLFIAQDYAYHTADNRHLHAVFKGCCTLVCLLLLVYRVPVFYGHAYLYIGAMAFLVAADVVICFRFKVGVALFGIAHVLFVVAFVVAGFNGMIALVVFPVAAGVGLYLVFRWKLLSGNSPIYLVYLLLLILLVSFSAGRGGLLPVAAAAFAASDLILIYNRHIAKKTWLGRANLALYYSAVFLLAVAYV